MRSELTFKLWSDKETKPLYEAVIESVASFAPWIPWVTYEFTMDNAQWWTGHCMKMLENNRPIYAVYLDDVMIGSIDLNIKTHEVGYWIRESYQRKGYGRKMLETFIDKAFNEHNVSLLSFMIGTENIASQRLVESFGAKLCNVLPDHVEINGRLVDMKVYEIYKNP